MGRCIDIIIKSDVDVATLEKALPQNIVKQIIDLRLEHGFDDLESPSFSDKHVEREAHTNLDDAHAIHYTVAYCDAKTTT